MAEQSDSNEIRITRVYDAPVAAVWDAWTVPEQVAKWWGPRGFTITTNQKDLRVGGSWRYTMHGPDGTDFPNITTYHVVELRQKLVYDHGATDDRPALFRVTATFAEAQGKTTLELRFALASPEAAKEMAKFIKRAGGNATWDRLAEHLAETSTGKRPFVIHRSFDAPVAQVFEMWIRPEHLAKWLPPAGSTMRFVRSEIAPGKSTLFVIEGERGAMHVRAEYLVIEPPRRLVYVQQFVDEQEQLAPAPFAEVFPATLLTSVVFTEEGPGQTRVTLTSEVQGETTNAQLEAFVHERAGMTLGWSGSFDAKEVMLAG